MKHLSLMAAAAAALMGIAGAPAQAAALPPVSTFVVETSFAGSSPIVEADGVWTGCTGVIDLTGSTNLISPGRLVFAGTKEVVCSDGNVVIQYSAELNWHSADHSFGKTSGEWQILESDNPWISGGAGTVRGTSRNCVDCIVDTFSGRVY